MEDSSESKPKLTKQLRPDNHLLFRDTKEDGYIPIINFQMNIKEMDKKDLKNWVDDSEYDGPLFMSKMSEMETSRKVVYCKKGHEMVFSSVRGYRSHWSCDMCRASHGPEPGFQWYWCDKESGGCDYCPNCYPSLEKTLVKKGYETSDPTIFELK